eukprot:CAMPEP_0179209466 /NCGR_PEP_ID=MMETSP0796-20121207/104468_1 /TAXON_ID=73915 /ORGANISM="Pyrodinium bahamense, Strain pbaha01" /LENGTH=503 /DNA_ID=CAMNT_0020914425 /DNA_START=84 /DNA_END=1591 /DNA_ORIENTATION=-
MINYRRGGKNILCRVLQLHGSVFKPSFCMALPCAVASFILKWFMDAGELDVLTRYDEKSVLKVSAVWSSFTFLVGFLIVFRTSQAYSRFWDGCTSTHQMRAEWFDACSSVIAFCRHSGRPKEDITRFEHMIVRLFSLLHAVALAEIEDSSSDDVTHIAAFGYELVDAASIDSESLCQIKDSDSRVELVYQWIQQLIVENISLGVLSIPPPLLSRTFQELANGMCQFHEAIKISTIPFPFPYAQTCDCLLLLQMVVTPLIVAQFVADAWWAALFAFVTIFIHWTLYMTAVEIENPFGFDPNDIDAKSMQLELNRHLMLLVSPTTKRTPQFSADWCPVWPEWAPHDSDAKMDPKHRKSLANIWNELGDQEMLAQRTVRARRHFPTPGAIQGWIGEAPEVPRGLIGSQSFASERPERPSTPKGNEAGPSSSQRRGRRCSDTNTGTSVLVQVEAQQDQQGTTEELQRAQPAGGKAFVDEHQFSAVPRTSDCSSNGLKERGGPEPRLG